MLPASLQPGLIHYRHPALLVIVASSAMIAAASSVNRAAVSSSRRNSASCQSRWSNTASRAVATRANVGRSRACLRRRYHKREIPSASHGRSAGLRGRFHAPGASVRSEGGRARAFQLDSFSAFCLAFSRRTASAT